MRLLRGIALLTVIGLATGCGSSSEPGAAPQADVRGPASQPAAPAPASPQADAGSTQTGAAVPQPDAPRISTTELQIPATAQLPTRTGGTPVGYKYQVAMDSQCTAESADGQKNKVDAETKFAYVWQWRGTQCDLVLDSLDVRTGINGNLLMESNMSRDRFFL